MICVGARGIGYRASYVSGFLGALNRLIGVRIRRTMMTEHTGLPVAGYQPQSDEKVALVNSNKETEERLLRLIDTLTNDDNEFFNPRWLSIAKTHFEQGFMALNRAIFQPQRISLPEDKQ